MNDRKDNLSCGIVRDLLPLYHDRVVSEVTEQAVSAHLQDCADCSAEYETLRTELPEGKRTDIKKRFSTAVKKMKHKGLIKGIAITAAAAAVLGGIWYFLTEVPIKPVPQDAIKVIRAYKYNYSSEDFADVVYMPDEQKGLFIYFEVPVKYFSGPTNLSPKVTDSGELRLEMRTPIITWNRTNDDDDATYEDIWNLSPDKLGEYSTVSFNGNAIENNIDDVPEYVKEYVIFEYGNTIGGWSTDVNTMTAYREDGTMTTWDLDGNVLYDGRSDMTEE